MKSVDGFGGDLFVGLCHGVSLMGLAVDFITLFIEQM